MKVKVIWEFDVDTDDFDPEFVDIPGLAKDLTMREVDYLLNHYMFTAYSFKYVVEED